MFTIIIQEKGGEQRRMVFNKAEVTIGRVQGNDIVLPKGNVSKRHARIVLKDGKFIIVDLKSTNGTYVNGRKITSPLVVKDSDKIYVGDFIIGVDEASDQAGDGPSETTTSPPGNDRVNAPPPEIRPPRPTEAQPMPSPLAAMSPLSAPEPAPTTLAPPAPAPRPGPPRPAPGPSRDLGPGPGAPLGRPGPTGAPMPSGPLAGSDGMPPISPPPDGGRARPLGRPGGTMPPPMAPIPPMATPMAAPQPTPMGGPMGPGMGGPMGAPMGSPMGAGMPMGSPMGNGPMSDMPPPMSARDVPAPMPAPRAMPEPVREREPAAPMPPPMAAPTPVPMNNGAPAPVVPLPRGNAHATDDKSKRQLAGVGARRVPRSVSMPGRRGVHLEPLDPKVVKMLDLQSNILERLRAKLDLDKIPIDRLHEEDLWKRAERATIDLVETLETSGELPKYIDQETLIKETLNEALALGPLEDLLADDNVDEIMIDKRDRVVVGKSGVLRGSGKAFSSDEVFERVVKRLVVEAGGHIDEANPLVDLRMRDGTRLTAAVSPVAARGACLVLKKTPTVMPQLSELVAQNAMSSGMADFLATCVTARRNILVCGGANSGKTQLVAAIAAASPPGERVISIEEVAELSIARDEWIQLEARAGGGGKSNSVDLGNLLETALRMLPDRLVVGDVRGREAMPLVCALSTSIDGAVVAMSGEGAAASLGRLLTLARVSAHNATDVALRELVAQGFEIVIHVSRGSDGAIKVLAIEEVIGCTEQTFDTHVLFQWSNGAFAATGTVPRFYSELEARGIPADQAVFR